MVFFLGDDVKPDVERGRIPVGEVPGGIDLQSTLESGQSYVWAREDGDTYTRTGRHGGSAWYYTVHADSVVRVRQHDRGLEWEAMTDAVPILEERLRLHDDLSRIRREIPDDPLIETAFETYPGLRVTTDPFFACLISFICSTQMRAERIFSMQQALSREYGMEIATSTGTYYSFPSPAALANTTEDALRDLGLGYRAPYVIATSELISTGELTKDDISNSYEAAREDLTKFVGVGPKVADCVCLFSLGHLEAVPLDTWMQTAISEYYPECKRESYHATSNAIREYYGQFAGYAQTYAFHYLRHHHES